MAQTLTATMMRSVNRYAILDHIRRYGPTTRTRIAKQLNVSVPTVMRIVDSLMAEDLVRPSGGSEVNRGRPAPLLDYNGDSYAVIGVDLGGSKMFGAVSDLAGNIQHEINVPIGLGDGQNNLDRLMELIQRLLDAPRPEGQRVRGIGIGAPGITLSQEGIVTWAPGLDWRDMPLKTMVSERFEHSVFVENDVNLSTLGELNFGAGRDAHNLVCIAIGTGIGAGIVINRALYRGHNQASGEIGYLVPCIEALGRTYGEFGAFEMLASGPGIARRAREYLIRQGVSHPPEELTAEDVFEAARAQEAWALAVTQETVDLLSLAVANVSTLFNPELVILGGGVARSADLLIDSIQRRIEGVVPYPPKIVASKLGLRAAVMGAITLVLTGTSDHLIVERVM